MRVLQSNGWRAAVASGSMVVAAILLISGDSQPTVSWLDLIAPLRPQQVLAPGFVLSAPRRGDAHDVVFVARRPPSARAPAARVEVHVVDRGTWKGVAETASFGVAWEVPPPDATIAATSEEASAVTRQLFDALAANDVGFDSVDSIPLTPAEQRPALSRVLSGLHGWRGGIAAAAALAGLALLASIAEMRVVVAVLLAAIGLALRLPHLDLPFVHDQDVQRMLTGNSPLPEVAWGVGLRDRHPPLYFFVLHFVQRFFGQSEEIARLPAALAGTAVGPAVFLAGAAIGRAPLAASALLGLALAISPPLIARSREVSEIPLYALLLVIGAGLLAAAVERPTRRRTAAIAATYASALYTYYLAIFAVAAKMIVLSWPPAALPARRALAFGAAAGLPALILGAAVFLRDRGAREVARAFPALAWGEHTPWRLAATMLGMAGETYGLPLLLIIGAAIATAVVRRERLAMIPGLAALATLAGVAALAAVARVQAYYITTVLPLAALTVLFLRWPQAPRMRGACTWLVAAAVLPIVLLLSGAPALYEADAAAFMPRFAALVAERPERRVVTVAHYDKTLLAYYLARRGGRSIAWHNVDEASGKEIVPLVLVHAMDDESARESRSRLRRWIDEGPLLVIERDAFLLPAIGERLSRCQPIAVAVNARMVRCAATDEQVFDAVGRAG